MPEFAHPAMLLLALGAPLAVWCWLRRDRGALRFPHAGRLLGLDGGQSRVPRWGGAGMRLVGLLALVVALAAPRWPDRHTRLPSSGVAIMMVADTSGSMAEIDFDWGGKYIPRMEAVKRAFNLFVAGGDGPGGAHLEGRPNDLVGLVTFAARPETACPLTLSHSVLLQILNAEEPRSIPTESETNIGDAIAWGLHRLESATASRKAMILLSDGEHNVPPPALKPRQAAQLAASLHVPIYTIDAGGTGSGGEAGGDKADPGQDRVSGEKNLEAVARITSGRHFQARDAQTLLGVCAEIDRLERSAFESFQYRRYYEGYPWFALVSLVSFVGIGFLEMTVWQRVP